MKRKLGMAGVIIALLILSLTANAQAPSTIVGDGFLAGVTSGVYPLASYGYYIFVPADSGTSYQVIGIYNVTNSSGSYSYTPTSSSTATINANDSVLGPLVFSANFLSASSGSYYETATSYPSANQSGSFGFSSVNAPSSIAGKTFTCSIVSGASPFYTSGSYTITIASSGNTYTVSTGQSGTYSYSTLNRSTGMLQLNDSVTGTTTAYFGFSSGTGGGFAIKNTTGGYQVGNFVLSTTTLSPSSITGDGFLVGVSSGAYPLASYGYFLFIPANSGNSYQVIGIYNVYNSSGSYSYTPTSSSAATINATDSVGGPLVLSASFSSASSGSFYETATSYPGSYQSGSFGFSSVNAPNSLVGRSFNCSIVTGASPFYSSGSYTISFASSGNTYTASTGQSGTYSYSTLNRSTGMLQLNDSVTGATTAYFGFSSGTGGGFAIKNATGFQVGNFVLLDTTLPTVSITSPTIGQIWSNSVFTVSGQASDNVQVSAVYYQIPGQGWNLATSGNNWANWTGNITLTPGTNIIQAYSVDSSGNQSAISSQNMYYLLQAPIQVQTNGFGTISPNYNGQMLEIGKSFSMTATPGSGCKFTNWTGSLVTSAATLNFTMASNLTFTANFIDTNKPTFSITNLVAGQRVSNAMFTVKGTAADNWQMSNVVYQLNGGAWSNAVSLNNWMNWSADLALMPGTNTILAYAADSSGNTSATNTLNFQFVVTNQLQLFTTGLGTILPNYNNAWLEVGRNYSITSAPAAGFKFTNWTSSQGWVSNAATLTFMMASNLTLTANFIDTNKPTLTITTPTASQFWSNSVFTAAGTANDNYQMSNVWYQLNGAGWNLSTTTNGWTNWTANLNLQASNNVLQAYAADTAGNLSTTSSVSFTYIVSDTLRVQTTGLGSLSPNYSNAVLQIGKSYNMTATAGTGFKFTNWILSTNWVGNIVSNNSTLNFVMQSNLTLQANFVDTNRPALSIAAPTTGQRWSNLVFTASGTATDNWQVASVQVQLNGGIWTNATGTTNWSAPLTLTPGTNTLAAYATDATGNNSPTNSVSFQYVVTNLLSVQATGLGTISPNYNNSWLEIGRNYSMTATPASGFVVTNWTISTNWLGGRITNNATVQFMMVSNLTLQVNFADVTKPTLTITAPTAGQKMTNALATFVGTASDNWKVAGVWYQLNSNTWNLVTATTNNYTNWTQTLPLIIGTNTLKAYALDLGGNFSTTNILSVISSNTFMLQLAFTNSLPMTTNGLVFNLQLSTGLNGHIQVSTNLTSWATLTNFVGSNSPIIFRDSGATNSVQRFYRAVIP